MNINNCTFKVTSAGALTATSATIKGVLTAGVGSSLGGFAVDNNSLYKGTWNTSEGIAPDIFISTGTNNPYTIANYTTSGWAIGAGDSFGVTASGHLYASAASFYGTDTSGSHVSVSSGGGLSFIHKNNGTTNTLTIEGSQIRYYTTNGTTSSSKVISWSDLVNAVSST